MTDTTSKAKRRRRAQYVWTAEAIRALREHMSLTQREMADELEVRQQTISEWETSSHIPHRSTQTVLSMIAERVDLKYDLDRSAPEQAANDSD